MNPPSTPAGSPHRGRFPIYCSGVCRSKVPTRGLWSTERRHKHPVSGSGRPPTCPKSLQQKGASVDICPTPPGPALRSHALPPCSSCQLCPGLRHKSPRRAETSGAAPHAHSSKDISHPSAQPCPGLLTQASPGAGKAALEIQRDQTKSEGAGREHPVNPGFCCSRASRPRGARTQAAGRSLPAPVTFFSFSELQLSQKLSHKHTWIFVSLFFFNQLYFK